MRDAEAPINEPPHGRDHLQGCLRTRLRRHRIEAPLLSIQLGSRPRLAQSKEPRRASRSARGRRGLESLMAKPTYSVDDEEEAAEARKYAAEALRTLAKIADSPDCEAEGPGGGTTLVGGATSPFEGPSRKSRHTGSRQTRHRNHASRISALVSCVRTPLPAAVVRRGNRRLFHRQGPERAGAGLRLLRGGAGPTVGCPVAHPRRGPAHRRQHRQAAGTVAVGSMNRGRPGTNAPHTGLERHGNGVSS
jgi:hypothetical protein